MPEWSRIPSHSHPRGWRDSRQVYVSIGLMTTNRLNYCAWSASLPAHPTQCWPRSAPCSKGMKD